MKILHVISTISPRYGGPSGVVRTLSAEQVKRGHSVTICTTNLDYPRGVLDVPTDKPFIKHGVHIWFHKLTFHTLYFSVALGRWLLRHMNEFDVVHVHGLYRYPPTFAAGLARRRGVPYLIRPHGSLDPFLYRQSRYSLKLKRLYEHFFDLPNLNHADAIQYTSEEEAERARFLELSAPSVILPNGLHWGDFEELPLPGAFRARLGVDTEQPLILFLGRLNFKKGLDLLIPAFAEVTESIPEAILAIVGPDNEGIGDSVRQWCSDHGVQKHVCFVDHVPAGEARQAYVDADVFVLPSYTENTGMTVIEAMACECPVVISDQVNIWSSVQNAGAGLVVRLDSGQISGALIRILEERDIAAQMGAVGRSLVKERFDWRRIAEQFDDVYGVVLDR
jgi:glycosyltransferase involved in cell wall biosynthesis